MIETNWYTVVADAMPAEQQRTFMERFFIANPHWRGAQAADILEALDERDSNLDQVEPFFERFPEIAVLEGATVVARAVIGGGHDLTPETFAALHVRVTHLAALRRGQAQIAAGQGLSPDEVRERLGRPPKDGSS